MDTTDRQRQRPRPRPRPKPNLQAAPSVEVITISSSSSKSPANSTPIDLVDDDEMFMRNRNRTAKIWTALEKRDKARMAENEDSDDDVFNVTPSRGKSKRKERSPWQGKKVIERLLSVGDLNDDEVEITGDSNTLQATQTPKKRQRTRSRSITPPPELPRYEVQYARRLVNTTLNIPQRAASPTDDANDGVEDIFMDPELAQLARSVAAERARSQASIKSDPAQPTEIVHISMKWQPHPLNPNGKEEFFFFKMNRDDNLQDLFETAAEEASILPKNLIVSYNNKRIYASVTPKALQIRGEAELVACDKITYDYIRTHPVGASDPISVDSDGSPEPGISSGPEAPPVSLHGDEADDSEEENDTFKLTLRSAVVRNDITLAVRPTTKCGSIVKAYLTKADLQAQYPEVFAVQEPPGKQKGRKKTARKDPRLCIDGERMDNETEIGDADLEDGDMVEVVGL